MIAMPVAIIVPPPMPWMPREMISCSMSLSAPVIAWKIDLSQGSPAAPESAEPTRKTAMPPT